jgi:GTP-binding protein
MALFAEFVISAASPQQLLNDNLPEIGMVGRSNVGKSSMINSITRMKKLARTSNTPGRTQTLNFYRIWPDGKPRIEYVEDPNAADRFSLRGNALFTANAANAFYFVDMPGYGFAKVSETQKQGWRKLIDHYLLTRPNLKAVVQVVDLRHPPSKDDVAMWEWLGHHGKVRLCLATKADKLPKAQRLAHLKEIALGMGMKGMVSPNPELILPSGEALLGFSSEEGLGRDELWRWMVAATRTTQSEESTT